MSEAQVPETQPAKLDRAMDALEQAAEAAEGASVGQALDHASRDDFEAAVKLDPAAVRSRLDRVMMGFDPELGLDYLHYTGCLAAMFPEIEAMVGFGDGEWRHKDVWKHTKQVVMQAEPRIELRWGALMHDIGKLKTRTISPDGKVQFLGHAEVGARMFDKIERRLRLFAAEPTLQTTIRFLVLHHLRANQYEKTWTDSAVRRFARELGNHLDDLLCLARADITTKRPEKKRRGLSQIDELQARIGELALEDAVLPPLPTGVGDEIMRTFGLRPSRVIGDIKRALEEAIERGELDARQPNEVYVAWVAAHAEQFGIPLRA